MQQRPLPELEYWILPGKPGVDFAHRDLYNQAYRFWRAFWGEILDEVGGDRRNLKADEFLRQDFFSAFVCDGEVVGMHTYTIFDLDLQPTSDHSFFVKYIQGHSLGRIREMNVSRLMTIEYFSLKPGWRGPDLGVSMGRVLGHLSLRVGEALGLDGVLGAARVDVGVAHIAYEAGMVPIDKGLTIFGKPTDIVLWTPGTKSAAGESVQRLVAELWERRLDTTGATLSSIANAA